MHCSYRCRNRKRAPLLMSYFYLDFRNYNKTSINDWRAAFAYNCAATAFSATHTPRLFCVSLQPSHFKPLNIRVLVAELWSDGCYIFKTQVKLCKSHEKQIAILFLVSYQFARELEPGPNVKFTTTNDSAYYNQEAPTFIPNF